MMGMKHGKDISLVMEEFENNYFKMTEDGAKRADEHVQKRLQALDVGENIRKILKKKNLTQKDLAEATGIARQQIQRYCTGKNLPNPKRLKEIADALEVSIMDLYEAEGVEMTDDEVIEMAKERPAIIELLRACVGLNNAQLHSIAEMVTAFRDAD